MTTVHPSPSSQPTHRKIEVQSPTDITHLQSLATALATSRLNQDLPPSMMDPDDALRARVEELLGEFLDKTYAGVRQNVSVNGVDLVGVGEEVREEEYEGFDARLAERLRKAEEKRGRLIEKVADLRRTGGSKAAERWKGEWEGNIEKQGVLETQGGAEVDVKVEDGEGVDVDGVRIDVGPMERWDEVVRMHEKALEGLVELKSGMSGTVGKLAEAKRVGEELGDSR